MCRHQTSQFQSAEWEAVRHGSAGMPLFMWKQSVGPFTPAVVTEDNEIHNICHLLTLFGETDLLLICGLPTHVQPRSWNQACRSQGFSGAVEVAQIPPPLSLGPGTLWPLWSSTLLSCAVYCSLMTLKSNCYTDERNAEMSVSKNVWPYSFHGEDPVFLKIPPVNEMQRCIPKLTQASFSDAWKSK